MSWQICPVARPLLHTLHTMEERDGAVVGNGGRKLDGVTEEWHEVVGGGNRDGHGQRAGVGVGFGKGVG